MKRFVLPVIAVVIAIYLAEAAAVVALRDYNPRLEAAFTANEYVLSWQPLPFLGYYEVEVLNAPPVGQTPATRQERVLRFRTWRNTFTIDDNFPYRTYWRVSARGLFRHRLGVYSDFVDLARLMGRTVEDFHHLKPVATSSYPASAPAPSRPMLTWTVVSGAVYYEIEFLSQPPENPGGTEPSDHRFTFSREVFINGYNADFSRYQGKSLWWRVRALDYDGDPLGVFSDAQEVFIDHNRPQVLRPLITTVFNEKNMATPLYPVYSWIPIVGAVGYEVELLSDLPETPEGTAPSVYRIWSKRVTGFACYDDEPRAKPGTYYWRVRGLDAAGNPVGVYSALGSFVVDLQKGNYAATFGDSVTHGGGAVSYSPTDWEYSFHTYLNFPVVNLGRSGDTSETMVERFERDVLPFRPKYLIILGGTNSLRGGTPAEQVIDDMIVLRKKCQSYGIRPIFVTLPPINPEAIMRVFNEETASNWRQEFDTVNNFIRQQRYHIDLDPRLEDAGRELPDYYAVDGLHPDIEAKRIIAQLINAHWARVTR
jgi:lysophospholipase L1-like esterase